MYVLGNIANLIEAMMFTASKVYIKMYWLTITVSWLVVGTRVATLAATREKALAAYHSR